MNRSEFCAVRIYAFHAVIAYLIGIEVAHIAFSAIGAEFTVVKHTYFSVHLCHS